MVLTQHKAAELAMSCALKTHPQSVALWLLKLEMVGGEDREELGEICKEALKQVPSKVRYT